MRALPCAAVAVVLVAGTARAQRAAEAAGVAVRADAARAGAPPAVAAAPRHGPHWIIPLGLVGGFGSGLLFGLPVSALGTRCFRRGADAPAAGAVGGLVAIGTLLAADEVAYHGFGRELLPGAGGDGPRAGSRAWLGQTLLLGGGLGAASGVTAGLVMHGERPGDCYRSGSKAALHGAALFGASGLVIVVPLAALSA